jgi:hypothetical protein
LVLHTHSTVDMFSKPFTIDNKRWTIRGARWPRSARFGVRSRKLSNIGQSLDGRPKTYYLELLRASEVTLSCWSRLHLQSIAPNNPYWARLVGYGPFSLCAIDKEGLSPSSGDINRLMMMMINKRRNIGVGRDVTIRKRHRLFL